MKLHHLSIKGLRRRKGKTALTVAGLVIAVATVVTTVIVSRVLNKDIAEKMDEYGANVLVTPRRDDVALSRGGLALPTISYEIARLHDSDATGIRSIRNADNVKLVSPKLIHPAIVSGKSLPVCGVDFNEEVRLKKWWRIVGAVPDDERSLLAGSEAAEVLGLRVGGSVLLNDEAFRIAGILEATGAADDGMVFIDLRRAQTLFERTGEVSVIEIAALCYDCPIEEIVRQVSEKIPGSRVTAIKQTIESKMEAMHRFEMFSLGFSQIILVVGGLIVFTNMTALVNERRREIGVLRAIGYRQAHVCRVILTELVLTCLAAGSIGGLTGYGAAAAVLPLVFMGPQSSPPMGGDVMLLGPVLALVLGIAAGIHPAIKASRLDPSVALRSL